MSDVKTIVESPKRQLQRDLAEMRAVDPPLSDNFVADDVPHYDSLASLASSLAKAQGAMANAAMNRVNPHFKSRYADLASVLDAIRKPLSDNGLCITQTIEIREKGMVLRTILLHSSGQSIASEYPLPSTARPQEMGSALTYARRYSISALVCNAADEDDDANAAETSRQTVESNGRAKRATPVGLISEDELAELMAEIEELTGEDEDVSDNVRRFCEHQGVKSLNQISDLKKARDALAAKRRARR